MKTIKLFFYFVVTIPQKSTKPNSLNFYQICLKTSSLARKKPFVNFHNQYLPKVTKCHSLSPRDRKGIEFHKAEFLFEETLYHAFHVAQR